MSGPEEFNYACQKCPRTFKLEDFYSKHLKVHELKRQHVCAVCGFVYGAAKGLEGHMESAHSSRESQGLPFTAPTATQPLPPQPPPAPYAKPLQELPFGLGFHFLQRPGSVATLDQARLAQESASLLQKAHQAMLAQMNHSRATLNGLSLVPLSISAASAPSSPSVSPLSRAAEDKSKIPSPAGTGNYKIYDDVPEIHDAGDAQQNDSGFFRCTICTREFSGLNSLKKHVPIHTRRVQHKCDTCGYVFGKKEYLLDHMRKHTGEISPVCEVCGQTFNKSLKLKEHQKLHRNTANDGNPVDGVPYRCHICKQCFTTPEPLGDHLRSQHSETVYKCDMCDATFGDVRGKNHHMYNEHQLDAFHQKCVWCPVCNQGFTRHYNLKVHMYKSHGKEYLENNFSAEELDSLMRPPPGSNTSKPSPSPRKVDKEEIVISGAPTGILPMSPPLTPKLSPKQKSPCHESPMMVATVSLIPPAGLQRPRCRPGPASLTKPRHYFDEEAQHAMVKCQLCEDKFLRKSDLYIHLRDHGVTVFDCEMCEDRFLEGSDLKHHLALVHGQTRQLKDDEPTRRRPGPASRTNAPKENRVEQMSNLPSHLAAQYPDSPGYPCTQCGKVLMHKQSYVSHMRVIHGDYYGGNKWRGSSVVQMVLGDQEGRRQEESTTALANITNHPEEGTPHSYNDYKFGLACEFCNKAFSDESSLEEHVHSKHPYLTKRIQAFKEALGLKDSEEPDTKRLKLDYEEVHSQQTDRMLKSAISNGSITSGGGGNNNSIISINNNNSNNNNLKEPVQVETDSEPLSLVLPSVLTPPSDSDASTHSQEQQTTDEEEDEDEEDEDGEEDLRRLRDRHDDVRFEPITEEFLFEGRMIRPSYCVLPFVTDDEVERFTQRNISEYYEVSDEFSEDEGEMVIDERSPSPPRDPQEDRLTVSSNYNNNEIKINKFGQGFANSTNICKTEDEPVTATHTVRLESTQPFFYPPFSDFTLPFSLSSLLQKKKEMAAILVPRLQQQQQQQTNQTKLTLEHLTKAAMAMKCPISPVKSDPSGGNNNNNTAVSEYEHQIQNDMWPIDCIKCSGVLPNLDNFNVHMNDHWSDDKCCPVCGLLINSKRFNFKQHLKIHTGEKPFVCQVCSRAFRQKAHMVKHVTTHRAEHVTSHRAEGRPANHDLVYHPGVIVQ